MSCGKSEREGWRKREKIKKDMYILFIVDDNTPCPKSHVCVLCMCDDVCALSTQLTDFLKGTRIYLFYFRRLFRSIHRNHSHPKTFAFGWIIKTCFISTLLLVSHLTWIKPPKKIKCVQIIILLFPLPPRVARSSHTHAAGFEKLRHKVAEISHGK